MKKVLELAEDLKNEGIEIPVAAIVVKDGEIVGSGVNTREKKRSILGHAEINAIKDASKNLKQWNLEDCTLYISLEPCPMCAGAILQSHIKNVVYGASEPKSGAFGSRYNIDTKNMNITSGVLEEECRQLLCSFFAEHIR